MADFPQNFRSRYRGDQKTELINGNAVSMPSPCIRHHDVVSNIHSMFSWYLKDKKSFKIFRDSVDVHLTRNNIFVPDFILVTDKNIIKDKGVYGAPDLVVEVLANSTAKNDRLQKKYAYQEGGVKEYWLVDILNKSVEVYWLTDGVLILRDFYAIPPTYDLEDMDEEEKLRVVYKFKTTFFDDLTIDIREIFEE